MLHATTELPPRRPALRSRKVLRRSWITRVWILKTETTNQPQNQEITVLVQVRQSISSAHPSP